MASPKTTSTRDQRVAYLPSSPPVYTINRDALRKLGLGIGEDDDTCSISSEISDQLEEVRSEDIDGPTDFTANFTYWMRHADLRAPGDDAHEISAADSYEGKLDHEKEEVIEHETIDQEVERSDLDDRLHVDESMLSKADAEGTKLPDNEANSTIEHDDLSDVEVPSSLSLGDEFDNGEIGRTQVEEKGIIVPPVGPTEVSGSQPGAVVRQESEELGSNTDLHDSSTPRTPHGQEHHATEVQPSQILGFADISIIYDTPPVCMADHLLRRSNILTICNEEPEPPKMTGQPLDVTLPSAATTSQLESLHTHLTNLQDRQDAAFANLATHVQQLNLSVQTKGVNLERQRDSAFEHLSAELARLERQLLDDRCVDAEARAEECEALLDARERDVERLEGEVERLERKSAAATAAKLSEEDIFDKKSNSTPSIHLEEFITLQQSSSTLKTENAALQSELVALRHQNQVIEGDQKSSTCDAEVEALRSELEALRKRNRILEDDRELMSKALMKEWGRRECGSSRPQLYRYKYAGQEGE